MNTIFAGAAYFAIVFAAGFILGAARTFLLAPVAGEMLAVLVELPFILAVSWFASRWVIARLEVADHLPARLGMGFTGLFLLLIAEAALSVTLGGRGLGEHFALYRLPPAQMGLLAQFLFALFPSIQLVKKPAAR